MAAIPVTRNPHAFDALYVRNDDGEYEKVGAGSGGGISEEDFFNYFMTLTQDMNTLRARIDEMYPKLENTYATMLNLYDKAITAEGDISDHYDLIEGHETRITALEGAQP